MKNRVYGVPGPTRVLSIPRTKPANFVSGLLRQGQDIFFLIPLFHKPPGALARSPPRPRPSRSTF